MKSTLASTRSSDRRRVPAATNAREVSLRTRQTQPICELTSKAEVDQKAAIASISSGSHINVFADRQERIARTEHNVSRVKDCDRSVLASTSAAEMKVLTRHVEHFRVQA